MTTSENREEIGESRSDIETAESRETISSNSSQERLAEESIEVAASAEPEAAELPSGKGATPGEASSSPQETPRFRNRPIFLDFDLLQLAGIAFLLDQLTKFLVRAYLPFGHSYPATGFFRFTHAENTGSAFGILQGHNTPLIIVSFVGIFVLAMIYQSQPRRTNLLRLSLALQIGGALGNLLDRFRLGAVTDFIDVGPWPIFNLADASIISGLAVLGWILLRPAPREPQANEGMGAARDYTLKRRGRCARCRRFHPGRRGRCGVAVYPGNSMRRLPRRVFRR